MLWNRVIIVEVMHDEWGLPVINTYRKTGVFGKELIHKSVLVHDTDIERHLDDGVPAEVNVMIIYKRRDRFC